MKKLKKYLLFVLTAIIALTMLELSYPSPDTASVAIEAASVSENGYIKWIDFTPTTEALVYAAQLDIKNKESEHHLKMYELLAIYSATTGGSYDKFRKSSLDAIIERYKGGIEMYEMTSNQKLLNYYLEAYEAILSGVVGEYRKMYTDGTVSEETEYGIRVFSPIAKGYYYNHFDDFGASRSYGYKRSHLGHDLLGSVGTPVVAVESGYVEACGWNQYGGWRIGIRSFDGKRYYYYAHLRKGHPYNDIYEGKIVNAGEVIGYLGMTGYSAKEDTNNIDTPHLHYGLQIIFDKSQKDGSNQIWIDMYALTDFFYRQRSSVSKSGNEMNSSYSLIYPEAPD